MKFGKILSVFLAIVIIASCNSTNNEIDYRDAFVGEYIGVRINNSWVMNDPPNNSQHPDTVLVVAVGDSSVRIGGTEIMIGIDGSFFQQGGGSVSSYYSAEFFSGDSLITDQNSGGLGGSSRSTFKGKK